MVNTDEKYMKEAIKQAKKAYAIGEVPIGCVIVYEDKIIGRGYNRRTIEKIHWHMRSFRQFEKPAKKWTIGDWKVVRCMLHWNRVRCAPVQSFSRVWIELS